MKVDLKTVDTHDLIKELRNRGLPTIVWMPSDMDGFGDPDIPDVERLEACKKSLEDRLCEVGWQVIEGVLGCEPD